MVVAHACFILNPLLIPSMRHFANTSLSQTTVFVRLVKKKKLNKFEEVEYLGVSLKRVGKCKDEILVQWLKKGFKMIRGVLRL